MAHTKRSPTRLSLFTWLVCASVLGSACSMSLEADFVASNETNDTNTSGGNGSTGAGGGSGIELPGPSHPAPSGKSSFTELCGGGCMTDESAIGCTIPMSPDSNPVVSCQIVPTEAGASAQCLPAGTSGVGEPCTRTADCGAGLGCVLAGSSVGSCRAYCCGDVEACEKDSYCAPVPIVEDTFVDMPPVVPACIPASGCTVLDDASCPESLTCTLVRLDGTTSCVTPGAGKLGDPCPCDAGFVCANALGKCLALCHVGGADCPADMFCQGGAKSFPDGIGVCVK